MHKQHELSAKERMIRPLPKYSRFNLRRRNGRKVSTIDLLESDNTIIRDDNARGDHIEESRNSRRAAGRLSRERERERLVLSPASSD